jgi:hypothetical protein
VTKNTQDEFQGIDLAELAERLSDMLANPVNKSHEDFVEMLYDTLCERIWDNLFENNFPGQCGDALLRADDTFIRELTDKLLEDGYFAMLTARMEKLEGFVREAMKADHN